VLSWGLAGGLGGEGGFWEEIEEEGGRVHPVSPSLFYGS